MISFSDKNGIKDVYDYLKQNGGLSDKGDGIQLFKVTGKVDNNLISKHLQDSRKIALSEGDDKPAEIYYETKVLNDWIGEDKAADDRGIVKSITIKREQNNDLHKDKDIKQLLKKLIRMIKMEIKNKKMKNLNFIIVLNLMEMEKMQNLRILILSK